MSDHLESYIEPELEARVVALVLGEASDFEKESLERLIAASPELALFRQRIEATHALLRETVAVENAAIEKWKLPPEKRAAVREKIAAQPKRSTAKRRKIWPGLGIAALIAGLAILGSVTFFQGIKFQNRPNALAKTTSEAGQIDGFAFVHPGVTLDDAIVSAAAPQPQLSAPPIASVDRIFSSGGTASAGAKAKEDLVASRSLSQPQAHDERLDFDADQPAESAATGEMSEEKRTRVFGSGGTVSPLRFFSQIQDRVDQDRDERLKFKADQPTESAAAGEMSQKKPLDSPASETADRKPQSRRDRSELDRLELFNHVANENLKGGAQLAQKAPMKKELEGPVGEATQGLGEEATRRGSRLRSELQAQTWEVRDQDGATLAAVDNFLSIETDQPAGRLPKVLQKQMARPMEKTAAAEPFSTFSLHVSDVSFKLALAALRKNEWPDPERIRIEEFVNAFDYQDSLPTQQERVAATIEQAIHPTMQQRNMLRIAMRTAAAGRAAQTPLHLTFVLDSSGSMERFDRQETLQRAFSLLADQLKENDRVTLISFAREPRLVADALPGNRSAELAPMVVNLPKEGGTNLESALNLAFSKARDGHAPGSQSRVILLTDGAANLGDANPERLSQIVEKMRENDIAFDAAGIGAEGLNDEILEALTRKGDGRYYLLDRPEDADHQFASQIAGAMRPAAKNVKVQVEFNPRRVGRYQLHGFEKHLLNQEDFRDDQVDAAEISAAEAGVALYQIEPLPEGEGDIGSVSVRFRDMDSGNMVEKRWPIPYQPSLPTLRQAPESIRIASLATVAASKWKGEPLGQLSSWNDLKELYGTLSPSSQQHERVAQLGEMIAKAAQLEAQK